MTKGTGIATYARSLNSSLRRIGLRTEILYGPVQQPPADRLLGEIALFDAAEPGVSLRGLGAYVKELAGLRWLKGETAKRIAVSGEVDRRQIAARAPECDGLWARRDLFHRANRAFNATGRFTPLAFDVAGGAAPDVAHWTCPLPIRASGRPNVYTIHDLVPLRLPFATLDNKARFLDLCLEICRTADRVVTVSEHSKADIVRLLGVEARRVEVTWQTVDLPAGVAGAPELEVAREVEGAFGLPWRGYFLFYGAIEPKKNLGRVIEAYLAAATATPLVIIGSRAWLDEDETRLLYGDLVEASVIREGVSRRADRIRQYEFLPRRLLMTLVRGARAVLAPSIYEGFGLPVLESMTLGTPVLTSTEGSLPEIAGDAALLVDPYDVDAIRRGIQALDADESLRTSLVERGRSRSERFNPAAYDGRVAELYRSLA